MVIDPTRIAVPSRREFLSRCATLSVGSASLYATLGSLSLIHAQQPDTGDYKALVCVFLYGGNDGYNMVVPQSNEPHQVYANARQALAIERDKLLPLTPLNPASDGADYGLHPSMAALAPLFASGQLAVLGNVGALIRPLNRAQFLSNNVSLPPQLFSHNDQQAYWQSFASAYANRPGWGGLIGELLASVNDNQALSLNINLGQANSWQIGRSNLPYSIGAKGAPRFSGLDPDGSPRQRRRFDAFRALLDGATEPLFAGEYAAVQRRSLQLSDEVNTAFNANAAPSAGFQSNRLGEQLQAVARMIAARQALGQSRQIFFVGFGGWDTHADQLARHPQLLGALSSNLAAFYRATETLGVADQVTSFTMSDFGRTLTSNGDGSDHGWGSHQLILGGAVHGQNFYGEMPLLDIEGPFDAGRGRIIPGTSIEQYGATLARWFGLSDGDIATVFPNLGNFASADLGFMRPA